MTRLCSAATLVAVLGAGSVARAQISPGPLSRSHANLEGSSQCLRCHDPKKGVSPPKCLECHTLLRQRVEAGLGLHARSEYRDCKRCHVEHQGAEADLVWWGSEGRAAFDHTLTGYVLAGAHVGPACEACHRRHLTVPKADLQRAGVSPSSTYLGLSTACGSCHRDVHQGRFAGRACDSCHGVDSWTQVTRFDHDLTAYPLTGAHQTVNCDRCHPAEEGAKPTRRRLRGIAFARCTDCHRDPHGGRLGPTCTSCHVTASWQALDQARFDHAKTGYPLEGRHRSVTCAACHIPGKPLNALPEVGSNARHGKRRPTEAAQRDAAQATPTQRIRMAHGACSDCHTDAHLAQLAHRPDRGRCESCHSVAGFLPVRFSIEDHARTRYPLEGAHLAVPCNRCHGEMPRAEMRRLSRNARGTGLAAVRLRFTQLGCVECHRDPHAGDLRPQLAAAGCESCHLVRSWQETTFDHGATSFPLVGRHASVGCAACHRRADGGKTAGLTLRLTSQTCVSCHRDPHAGQFDRAGQPSGCERCHTTLDWRPTLFDHARETGYALDGAHMRLACIACHARDDRGSTRLAADRLPTTCVGCHGPSGVPAKEKP